MGERARKAMLEVLPLSPDLPTASRMRGTVVVRPEARDVERGREGSGAGARKGRQWAVEKGIGRDDSAPIVS